MSDDPPKSTLIAFVEMVISIAESTEAKDAVGALNFIAAQGRGVLKREARITHQSALRQINAELYKSGSALIFSDGLDAID